MTDLRPPTVTDLRLGRRLLSFLLSLGLAAALLVVLPPTPSQAAPCDAPVSNEVACENSKPGSPQSEWDIGGAGSSSIQGFATDISVNRGSTIGFKVKTTSANYRLDIYRMGYYNGLGARKITTINVATATSQPACLTQSSTGLIDCGNWAQTAAWAVPSTAVSGIYFAKLVAGSASSQILFVVRNDASTSDLFFQTSDSTWQAYNNYGGNSLYVGSPAGRAYKVSYNRPFNTNAGAEVHDFVWNAEYPMVRFLEANGYDTSYTTGIDSDRRGNLIRNHKTFLSVGHDEYWSGGQRTNVEAARDAGVNLAFFSGNEAFWKTRWENSIATGGSGYRTLVGYKETLANAKIDPAGASMWTGTWRDPRFSPPGDGGRPENALTGTLFMVNCCTTDMNVDAVDGQLRFWRNTRVAGLTGGQRTTLGSGLLGYEWDESPDNGYQPPGLIKLSTTTGSGVDRLQDYGSSYAPGTATHHLTMYRAPSGALVFGAGTIQWAWGLDDNHAVTTGTSDDAVQQATVNLLADMGAQPASLRAGLVPATGSTDAVAPTSTISAPAAGAAVPVGQPVTISGTATDAGGGTVAGVEVSIDNGTSWHPATGRASWSYTFTPGAAGTLTIKTRATDDSVRTEAPAAGRTLTVGSVTAPAGSCPCTVFAPTAAPAVAADPDTGAIEVGMKFRTSSAGTVGGIRFFKGSGNTGTHVGSLWSVDGTRLATATFSGESATGWQQVNLTTPVAVAANTTYVVSYFAPNGRYSTSEGYFSAPVSNGPLTALQDGADGANGVYKYGTTGFPTVGFRSSNYWVDVVFSDGADTTRPTPTATTPADGATDVAVGSTVAATFSEPVTASSADVQVRTGAGTAVTGSTSYDSATRTVTFAPGTALAAATAYTVTVSGATDIAGNTMAPVTWGFTTAPPANDTTPPSLTARTPAAGAINVATSSTVTATFDEAIDPNTVTVALSSAAGPVSGSSTYASANRTVTFTPSSALAASTVYTVSVTAAKDLAGNTMSPASWTFTTAPAPTSDCPCSVWPSTATPAVAADPDTGGVELGLKFRTSTAGSITGVRFYKGAGNSGTHVGSLWSQTGTRLASVTFTGESATGWQQVNFASPVAVTANTTYLVSYYAPNGRYSVTENAFATAATTRGPLTALQNGTDGSNGVYRYGSTGFPTSMYRSSNYWVDVVFQTD